MHENGLWVARWHTAARFLQLQLLSHIKVMATPLFLLLQHIFLTGYEYDPREYLSECHRVTTDAMRAGRGT